MRDQQSTIGIVARFGILCVIVFGFLMLLQTNGISFQAIQLSRPSSADVGGTLLGFLLISLFIERAVEVYTIIWRRPKQLKLASDLRHTKKAKSDAIHALERSGTASSAGQNNKALAAQTAAINIADAQIVSLIDTLGSYKSETSKQATTATIFLGLVIAICGIQVLSVFLENSALVLCENSTTTGCIPSFQYTLFMGVDIVVTAAVLGGGADGIHKIISLFTSYSEETKRRIQQAPAM
jgi:hypothetical protein